MGGRRTGKVGGGAPRGPVSWRTLCQPREKHCNDRQCQSRRNGGGGGTTHSCKNLLGGGWGESLAGTPTCKRQRNWWMPLSLVPSRDGALMGHSCMGHPQRQSQGRGRLLGHLPSPPHTHTSEWGEGAPPSPQWSPHPAVSPARAPCQALAFPSSRGRGVGGGPAQPPPPLPACSDGEGRSLASTPPTHQDAAPSGSSTAASPARL